MARTGRKRHKPEYRRERGKRQVNPHGYDGKGCNSQGKARPALDERYFIGPQEINDKGLRDDRFDEPARVEKPLVIIIHVNNCA